MHHESQSVRAISTKEERFLKTHSELLQQFARQLTRRVQGKIERDEFVSAGTCAALKLLRECDRDHEAPRIDQLKTRIRSAMFALVRQVDLLSRHERTELRKCELAERELEGTLGRAPTAEELSRALGMSLEQLFGVKELAMPRFASIEETLSTPIVDEVLEDTSTEEITWTGRVNDVIDSGGKDPLAVLVSVENSKLVQQALQRLPDREKQCITLSFYENLTLKEIGERFGVTEARASQLRSSGLRRMGKFLRQFQ